MRYNAFKIIKEGLTGNKGWTPAWREPEPKFEYDMIIIGGGGHGLATAYYLAKNHGIKNIAVVEKGYRVWKYWSKYDDRQSKLFSTWKLRIL